MIYDTSKEIEINKLLSRLDALLSKKCIIELKEKKKTRTVSQNAYLHVCITLFAIESGNHIEDAKQLLKRACHFMHTFDGEKIKTKLTRDLNTQELTDFIEWIRTFSAMQGNYIPTADEYRENKFAIDSEIEKNKNYL
jgi:HD superfamily phosphodiesterase